MRQPTNTSTRPSSRRTGTDTSSTRLGRDRTARTASSRPMSFAASSSRSTSACQGSNGVSGGAASGGGAGSTGSDGAGGSSALVTPSTLPASNPDPAEELRQAGHQRVRFDRFGRNPGHVVGVVTGPGHGGGVDRFGGEVEDDVVVGGRVVTDPFGPAEEAAHPYLETGFLQHLPGQRRLETLTELDPPPRYGPLPHR